MVKRQKEERILTLLKQFPAIGIVGPRQVGKTTIAKGIIPKIKKNVIYLDLELLSDLGKLTNPEIYLSENSDKCIIIDEIQRRKDLFPLLRALIDQHNEPGRFILLGSASPELIRNSSESLAGRIIYNEITSFNVSEVGYSKFGNHWFRGGFPRAFLSESDTSAMNWITSFVQSYVERDLPQLGLNVSPIKLYRFFRMLAHSHGSLWNSNLISKSLESSRGTINRYTDFFEHSYLIRKLEPFHANTKKRLVKSPKMYLRDTGLLHYLLGISNINALKEHIALGNSWEGYVIEQILQLLPTGFEGYFYRTQQGSECDLLITHSGKPFSCIEIKYSEAPKITKGFRISINDLKTPSNYIITPYSDDYPIDENIRVCSLERFLNYYLDQLENLTP